MLCENCGKHPVNIQTTRLFNEMLSGKFKPGDHVAAKVGNGVILFEKQ